MPHFSESSKTKLASVDPRLQRLFNAVIEHYDCKVIFGMRTQEEQQALYAQGRTTPGKIVTHMDGVKRRSRHQDGLAVDVVPYPIDWKDLRRFNNFGWFVKGMAAAMDIEITWGGDWKQFKDYPHFEVS